MKKRSFFIDTVILTTTAQLSRIIGIVFTVFLSNKIGTEGIGLFQLTNSIYFLAITLASSGVGVTVSRLVAEALGKSRHKSVSNVLKVCIGYSLFFGITVGTLLYLFSDTIAVSVLNDARAAISLKILAPSMPFMAVASSLRGYFYGVRKVAAPASDLIIEQIVQVCIVVAVIDLFLPRGLEYACGAAFFAASVAEMFSTGYVFMLYLREKRKSRLPVVKKPGLTGDVLRISIPVALSSYLRSGLRTLENILIPAGLKRFGASGKEALSQYGLLLGMVMPVLMFPSAFLSAFSTLLVPEVAEANAVDNQRRVSYTVSRVFQVTLFLSILFSGIFIFFSNDIGVAIYNNREAGLLIKILSPLIPLMYLDFIVDGLLNGLNQQLNTLRINILDYSMRIGLILLLIPRYGLYGYIAILFFSTILNACLSIARLLKVSKICLQTAKWILKPFLCVMAAGTLVALLAKLLPPGSVSIVVLLIAEIVITIVLYIVFSIAIQCVTKEDIAWFKRIIRGGGRTSSLQKESVEAASLDIVP